MSKYILLLPFILGGFYGIWSDLLHSDTQSNVRVQGWSGEATSAGTLVVREEWSFYPDWDVVAEEIIKVFSSEGPIVTKQALDIAYCESRYKYTAKNKFSSAEGVFQFIDATWVRVRRKMGRSTDLTLKYHYKENIETAKVLYKMTGWREWECNKVL